MLEKLAGIEARYEEINRLLMDIGGDYERAAELNKERIELEPIVQKAKEYRSTLKRIEDARTLLASEKDAEMRILAETEINELDPLVETLESSLKSMLVPKDSRDEKNVFAEIRAGAGGEEAAIFAMDLFRMYTRYAERHGWKYEIVSASEIGIGGYKEVIFEIRGHGAYSKLKYESGVHRVQRVPTTESSGRIHTSTATVAVLPEAEEVEEPAGSGRARRRRAEGRHGRGPPHRRGRPAVARRGCQSCPGDRANQGGRRGAPGDRCRGAWAPAIGSRKDRVPPTRRRPSTVRWPA
jgi:peptide chain release factor 1